MTAAVGGQDEGERAAEHELEELKAGEV